MVNDGLRWDSQCGSSCIKLRSLNRIVTLIESANYNITVAMVHGRKWERTGKISFKAHIISLPLGL